jgi:hypothetical protein
MDGGREKGEWWTDTGNSTMIYLIYCKNFCKWHNIPPPRTTIKNKSKKDLIDDKKAWGEIKELKNQMTKCK